MRKGFTLIELMIVIAIIAIIAAIAIPNLLESRIVANESGAATSLKSGIFPAEVQFQAGNYADDAATTTNLSGVSGTGTGGNGIGDFAYSFNQMAGGHILTGASAAGSLQLTLLPQSWNSAAGAPINGNYIYHLSGANESGFAAGCYPSDQKDTIGRRCFALNATGSVYATAAAATNPSTLIGNAVPACNVPFSASTPLTDTQAGWSPYKK